MICVLACCVFTSQMVHVVSMHAVPNKLGSWKTDDKNHSSTVLSIIGWM